MFWFGKEQWLHSPGYKGGKGSCTEWDMGLGSLDLRTIPSGQNLYALVLIHTTAVTAPHHRAKILLPVL